MMAATCEGTTLGALPLPSKPVTWQVLVMAARVGGRAINRGVTNQSTSVGRCRMKPVAPPFCSPMRRSSSYSAG